MDDILKGIGKRIRHARRDKDITQQELANRLGYTTRSSIAKIESGEVDIPLSKLVKFAEILAVDPVYLLFGDEYVDKND